MPTSRRPRAPRLLLPLLLAATPLPAQQTADSTGSAASPFVRIGGWAEERLRLDQLLGRAPAGGYLLRTASSRGDTTEYNGRPRLRLILPEARVVRNSAIPLSLNQGSLFASRGTNLLVGAGLRTEFGPVSVTLAPEITYEPNGGFQIIPYVSEGARDYFASPWYWGTESADLPLRHGASSRLRLHPGQSRLAVTTGPVRSGVATEEQWWGPGVRNALVLSNNAGGFPHAFVETARPLRTRVGQVEARWIVGRLSESAFFDTLSDNDSRALAGIAATLTPNWERGLTVGIARVVYGPDPSPLRAFDVFRGVGHPNVTPLADTSSAPGGGRDQILSLFGRWLLPVSGVEVYGEWARTDLPRSLRDLIEDPSRSRGYTVGMQWGTQLSADGLLRLYAEATSLEQTYRGGTKVAAFYTSRAVPQGYTHGGRVLGAAIGPGAASQWVGSDYVRPAWHAGLSVGRVRWANDAFYRFAEVRSSLGHDVSLLLGARGGVRLAGMEVSAEFVNERRLNYLFQSKSFSPAQIQAIDIVNRMLTLTVRPARRSLAVRAP